MTSNSDKKTSYALNVQSAYKQLEEAETLINKGISMMELFFCGETELLHKDHAIRLLAEYITNNNFYANLLEKHLHSGNRMKNKKTGADNIVVGQYDFDLINAYVMMTAACENELALIGISMRAH